MTIFLDPKSSSALAPEALLESAPRGATPLRANWEFLEVPSKTLRSFKGDIGPHKGDIGLLLSVRGSCL